MAKSRKAADPEIELLSWRGMPMWRCPHCPWDTLEGEGAVRAHIAVRHAPPRPLLSVLVADARGREIKQEE